MKIVVIGAGNLSYHLAKRLVHSSEKGKTYPLYVVNHRDNFILQDLKNKGIECMVGLDNVPTNADTYIICVKDEHIREVALKLSNKIHQKAVVIHTSGAIETAILNIFENYGVIYPLYSFTYLEKEMEWKKIPVYYIGNNEYSNNMIRNIAGILGSDSIHKIDDTRKLSIHLLAVLANNFTNALLHSIYTLSKKDKAHQDILLYKDIFHLILQTIQRTENQNPAFLQTGPAIRLDKKTIEKHLRYLNDYPEMKAVYLSFTDYIQKIIANEVRKK